MGSFPLVDIVIAMVFVYLLLSLICSALKEMIEAKWKQRSAMLKDGVRTILGSEWAGKLYEHGLVKALYRTGEAPSYIPAKTFSTAMLDLIQREAVVPAALQQALDAIALQAGDDPAKLKAGLEDWYNAGMDRVSGWYKRHTQWVLVVIGCVVTIALNVDSVRVADAFSKSPMLAAAVVNQGSAEDPKKQLSSLGLPIGWDGAGEERTPPWISSDGALPHAGHLLYFHWAGWLVTIVAISFGAPFWFDVLNKFMVVRSTVKPDEKSPNESSKA